MHHEPHLYIQRRWNNNGGTRYKTDKLQAEVQRIEAPVNDEFSNFSGLLDKAQKNIQTGLNQPEDVAGARTRAIQKRSKGVDTLSNEEAL